MSVAFAWMFKPGIDRLCGSATDHKPTTSDSKREKREHMPEGTNDSGYGPFAPGSLREEAPEEEILDPAVSKYGLAEQFAHATFRNEDGTEINDIHDVIQREHLCGSCYHRAVCKHAPDQHGRELLVVVSRCLEFSPEQA